MARSEIPNINISQTRDASVKPQLRVQTVHAIQNCALGNPISLFVAANQTFCVTPQAIQSAGAASPVLSFLDRRATAYRG